MAEQTFILTWKMPSTDVQAPVENKTDNKLRVIYIRPQSETVEEKEITKYEDKGGGKGGGGKGGGGKGGDGKGGGGKGGAKGGLKRKVGGKEEEEGGEKDTVVNVILKKGGGKGRGRGVAKGGEEEKRGAGQTGGKGRGKGGVNKVGSGKGGVKIEAGKKRGVGRGIQGGADEEEEGEVEEEEEEEYEEEEEEDDDGEWAEMEDSTEPDVSIKQENSSDILGAVNLTPVSSVIQFDPVTNTATVVKTGKSAAENKLSKMALPPEQYKEHPSIIHSCASAAAIVAPIKGKVFLPCPLCPVTRFKASRLKFVRRHLERFHMKHSFVCKDRRFLICTQEHCVPEGPSKGTSHYHCVCGNVERRNREAQVHTAICMMTEIEAQEKERQPTGHARRQYVECKFCHKRVSKCGLKRHLQTHGEEEEVEGSNDDLYVVLPREEYKDHPSIIDSSIQASSLITGAVGDKQACPLCPIAKFNLNRTRRLKVHMDAFHMKHSFVCKDRRFMICRLSCLDGRSHYHCVCGNVIRVISDAELHCNLCMLDSDGPTSYHFDVKCTICGLTVRRSSVACHLKTHRKRGHILDPNEYHINPQGFIVLGKKENVKRSESAVSQAETSPEGFQEQAVVVETVNQNPDEPVIFRKRGKKPIKSKKLDPETDHLYKKRSIMMTDPTKATHQCDVCGYRSSKTGIRRHKLFKHAPRTEECEICGKFFHALHEMRRHRTVHFDIEGEMIPKAVRLWKERNPDAPVISLEDIEPGYEVRPEHLEKLFKCRKIKEEKAAAARLEEDGEQNAEQVAPSCGESGTSEETEKDAGSETQDSTGTGDESTTSKQNDDNGVISAFSYVRLAKGQPKASDVEKIPCEICSKLVQRRAYSSHMRAHTSKYSCEICGFSFLNLESLRRHLQNAHETGFFHCSECTMKYRQPKSLNEHMKTFHDKETSRVKCPHCNKVSTNQTNLQVHIKRVHERRKPHACNICGKSFFDRYTMTLHRLQHGTKDDREQIKKWECPYCGNRFRTKAYAVQHMNVHLGIKPFTCSCGKAFHKQLQALKHEKTHDKEGGRFTCDICERGYKTKGKLTAHLKLHNKNANYKCLRCPMTFPTQVKLERHSCLLFNESSSARALTPILVDNRKKTKKRPGPLPQVHVGRSATKGASAAMSPGRTPLKLYSFQTPQTPGGATNDAVPSAATSAVSGEIEISQQEVTISNAVKFMCGFCSEVFSSTDDITSHIVQAHEIGNTVPGMTSATLDTHGSVKMEADSVVVDEVVTECHPVTISYEVEQTDHSGQPVLQLQINEEQVTDHTY